MIPSHRSGCKCSNMTQLQEFQQEDRLRPVANVTNSNLTKEHTRTAQTSHQKVSGARPAGGWTPKQMTRRRHRLNSAATLHCSLPFVLLILFCLFGMIHRQPTTTGLAQAQFLFTYEINQESDESRVPRSSLFDPSSFRIVTPSQLQSSYQKLASQLPSQTSTRDAPALPPPPPPAPVVASAVPDTASSLSATPESSQQQQFQSLLNPQAATTLPSVPSTSSFLKQTSAALQSFAELFHLTPSSSPAPLAAFQAPASGSQQPPATTSNGIDQQAEARSLHEHWTQQQKRAHNQAAAAAAAAAPAGQVSAFQSFTTSPSVQLGGQTSSQAAPSHNQLHQQQHQSGSQASYWLTSNPLNAPDGNFLVEIKNAGESAAGNQEAEHTQSARSHHHHQQDQPQIHPNQNLPASQPHHQQQPSVTTASSFTRPASAQSSFLSTPTSAHFGLPAVNTNQEGPGVAVPLQQTSSQAALTPVATHVDRFNQQNFRKQHFQPQSQALHQHQARSLSQQQHHHHQQARQLTTPTSSHHHHHQHQGGELLESGHGQLQPPANTPEHFGGVASAGHSPGSLAAPSRQAAPLKSAEESLIAFRQQQQTQHDQQSALLNAVQNQFATQANRHSGAESTLSTGNSLTDDEPTTSQQPAHIETSGGNLRQKLPDGGLTGNSYSNPGSQQLALRQQQQQQQQQQPAAAPPSEIPKVSPQIYESFLLQQKDQYEKHMELLKQQQELNKLLEQKQKQQQQQQQQEADKRKRKKDEIERLEARKKANAAREQEQQLVAARKARQEAEEARRKQLRLIEEEEAKRRRLAEEERRYRELMEAREREEAKRKRQEAEEAAELARRQREQQERDALAEQQKRRREQQEAAEEAAKQQQQYRNYLKQQEELRKLLELKQKEDEAAQARQRQAGQMSQQQGGRLSSLARANKLALEHKERSRQTNSPAQTGGGQTTSWGGRQTRVRAVTVGSQSTHPDGNAPEMRQGLVPSSTVPSTTSTTTTATNSSTSSTPRVGARLSSTGTSGGLRRLKADEKAIRQKIPLYSGAGKYGLYRSDSNSEELAKLLEAVTLPPTSSTTSTTTTTTTTTTTQAPPLTSSTPSDLLDSDELQGRPLTSSSLSPLLNLRELSVTPPSSLQDQARATTGEPFSSTTIFDDDVPRRPVRNSASAGAVQQPRRSFPAPISPAASVTSSTRTTLTNRMGSSTSGNSSSTHRGASIGLASLPADSDNDGIPGRAGHEYPVLAEVPQTSFSCSRMKLSGFFADTETACQVVHLCQDGVQSSILCPNGTIFNQEKFSCQWWYEVNCARAPMFYQLNDNLYKSAVPSGGGSSSGSQDKESSSVELNKRTRTGGAATGNSLKRS